MIAVGVGMLRIVVVVMIERFSFGTERFEQACWYQALKRQA